MIQLRTLGAIDLRSGDGKDLRAILAQPKRLGLLIYLALAEPRGPHRRDRLIALFWPEQDTGHARNALSQAVFFLRRALGSDTILNRNGDEIQLAEEAMWCDASAFEAAIIAREYADAVDLYRGDFLSGFHMPDVSPELEDWLARLRSRYALQYADALKALADDRNAAHDYVGASIWLRRLAAHDPYSSRIALELMRSLVACGDRAAALQHARAHETFVAKELDMENDPTVAAFARELQSATAADNSAPPTNGEPTSAGGVVQPTAPRIYVQRKARMPWTRVRVAVAMLAAVAISGVASLVLVRLRTAQAALPIHRIVVLPLESASDSVPDYLAASLTDAITKELARLPQLSVIASQSADHYKGLKTPLSLVAKSLDVDGIIQGTARQDGHRIQLNLRLVHGPTGRELWAGHFDRDVADIVVMEAEVAEAIARGVHIIVPPDSIGERLSLKDHDFLTRGLYIRGEYELLTRTPTSLRLAIDFCRQAVVRDSTFAPGYACIAEAYGLASDLGYESQSDANDSVRVYVARSLAFDSTLAEAHAVKAGSLSETGDFVGAELEFKRAIQLEPSNAMARHWYAMLLATLGRGTEAIAENERARQLNPLSASIRAAGAQIRDYFSMPRPDGRTPEVIAAVDPSNAWPRAKAAVTDARAGNCSAALKEIRRATGEIPNNVRMSMFEFRVLDICVGRQEALNLLNTVKTLPEAHRHGYHIAMGFRYLGQTDSMFAWLDSTHWNVQQRFDFRVDKGLDSLRGNSRFQRVLHRMGF